MKPATINTQKNYVNPLECRGNYSATSNTLAVDGWAVTFGQGWKKTRFFGKNFL